MGILGFPEITYDEEWFKMFNLIGFISALVGNCQDTQLFPIGFQSYILVDMINIGFKYDWFHLPISLVFIDWWVIARTLSCPSVDCGQFARSRHRGHAALSDRCQVSVEHVVFECVRMCSNDRHWYFTHLYTIELAGNFIET